MLSQVIAGLIENIVWIGWMIQVTTLPAFDLPDFVAPQKLFLNDTMAVSSAAGGDCLAAILAAPIPVVIAKIMTKSVANPITFFGVSHDDEDGGGGMLSPTAVVSAVSRMNPCSYAASSSIAGFST